MTASALLAAARDELAASAAPQESLGVRAEPGRLFRRAPRIVRAGSAWRLGVLLVTSDARALAVGEVIRAAREVRRGYAAESARARAGERAAAFRGGFREGEVLHVDWTPIDLDAVDRGADPGPLRLVDGIPHVRWSAAGGLMPLDAYLRERVGLLRNPPERA